MPSHEVVIQPTVAQWTVQAMVRLFATFAILQGAGIVAGGPQRWADPSYVMALQVPGAPASWGITLLLLGACTLVCSLTASRRPLIIFLYATAVWFLAFALSRFAALGGSAASLDGAIASLRPFATCVLLAVAHRRTTR